MTENWCWCFMITIAIVEDDDRFANIIHDYLNHYSQENNIKFSVKRYSDGYEIADNYKCIFDIIFMDVEMGLMNGMEAAAEIRKFDTDVTIIFITNMAQYAIQGYSVAALDYVLKPVSYVAFSESLKKALSRIGSKKESYININSRDGSYKLKTSSVFWVESYGHRLTFHSAEGDFETTIYTMKEIEEKLQPVGFMRASSGMLVNLNKVSGTQNGHIRIDGRLFPVSRGKKSEFMAALVSRMVE
ncbi:MAG: response regulator transcription factor [Parasporobacterium sp.]|nr:response regulator transcription factor [Parasporobacterium sp.]